MFERCNYPNYCCNHGRLPIIRHLSCSYQQSWSCPHALAIRSEYLFLRLGSKLMHLKLPGTKLKVSPPLKGHLYPFKKELTSFSYNKSMHALFILKNLIFTQKQTNYYLYYGYYSIYLFLSILLSKTCHKSFRDFTYFLEKLSFAITRTTHQKISK